MRTPQGGIFGSYLQQDGSSQGAINHAFLGQIKLVLLKLLSQDKQDEKSWTSWLSWNSTFRKSSRG